MNTKTITCLVLYALVFIGTFGHALKDRNISCAENATNERRLIFCKADAPLVAVFNSFL